MFIFNIHIGILEHYQILIPNNKTLYKLENWISKSGEENVRGDVWKALERVGKDGYDLSILYSCVKKIKITVENK